MKNKLFALAAAMLMTASLFAAKESVLNVNFAQYAATTIDTLGGADLNPTWGEQVRLMNTNVYSLSIAGVLDTNQLYVNRNNGLLRYKDTKTIGLYFTGNTTFVIPELKKDDKIELAWNVGRSDGEYFVIDTAFTNVANLLCATDTATYVFKHINAKDGKEREMLYATRELTVLKDGDVRFTVPAVNSKLFVAYIQISREAEEPEQPEYELLTLAEYSEGAIQSGAFSKVHTGEAKDTISMTYAAKYNKNKTSCTVITFTKSMTADNHYVEVSIDGGFKAGDTITIQPFTSLDSASYAGTSKYANILMRTVKDSVVSNQIDLTGSTGAAKTVTDGHEEAGDPKTFGYVLNEDCDAVRFGRGGNTRINLLSLNISRKVEKETNYYLKNNWDMGDWTWKEMTKVDEVYQLENVVFGGSGVNLNTAAEDANSAWIALDKFQGDEIMAKDTVTLTLAISETDTVITATLIGRPEPVGVSYYLTGTINSWATADENYLFTANPETEGEYMLVVTLAEGDGIKVVSSEGTWYPDGMGNEYSVDAAHAGVNTIYFRPDGQGGEGWHNGFFFLETSPAEGINDVNEGNSTIKRIENGQLFILRDGKVFDLTGARVR